MNEESNICYYTNRYNEQFRRIEHYERYSQMMPLLEEDTRNTVHFYC